MFDKTGTLTKGVFQVLEAQPAGMDGQTLLGWAARAECYSNHPISQSLKAAWGGEVDAEQVTDVEELGGYGLTAKVDGHTVAVGNRRLMEKLGLAPVQPQQAGTVVFVAVDGAYAGWILLGDVVKEHAQAAIRGLKAEGVAKTFPRTRTELYLWPSGRTGQLPPASPLPALRIALPDGQPLADGH